MTKACCVLSPDLVSTWLPHCPETAGAQLSLSLLWKSEEKPTDWVVTALHHHGDVDPHCLALRIVTVEDLHPVEACERLYELGS